MSASEAVQRVSSQRDEDLIRIASSDPSEGYLPEVIEAAKAELYRRNISPEEMHNVTVQDEEHEKVTAHLSGGAALFFLVFGLYLTIPIIIAMICLGNSQPGKVREMVNYTLLGLILWVTLFSAAMFLF